MASDRVSVLPDQRGRRAFSSARLVSLWTALTIVGCQYSAPTVDPNGDATPQPPRELLSERPVFHGRVLSLRRMSDIVASLLQDAGRGAEIERFRKQLEEEQINVSVVPDRPIGVMVYLSRDFPPEYPMVTYVTMAPPVDPDIAIGDDGVVLEVEQRDFDHRIRQISYETIHDSAYGRKMSHDLEFFVDGESIPQAWRSTFAASLQSARGQALKIGEHERDSERRLRTAPGTLAMHVLELLVEDIEWSSWSVDVPSDLTTRVVWDARARDGSRLDRFLKQFEPRDCRFAGLRNVPDTDLLVWSWQLDDIVRRFLVDITEGLHEEIAAHVPRIDSKDHPDLDLLASLTRTFRAGSCEGFVQVAGVPGAGVVFLGGIAIEDHGQSQASLAALIPVVFPSDENDHAVHLDAEQLGGTRIHRIAFQEEDGWLGRPLELWLACDGKVLWWAFGGGEVGLELRNTMENVAATGGGKLSAGIEMQCDLDRWLPLFVADESDEVVREWQKFLGPESNQLRLFVKPARQGMRMEVKAGKSWTRMLAFGVLELDDL